MRVDRRLLGWGLFFILVGAIPLATRFGALDPVVVGRWPLLWPLLLIGWGIGLVLRRTPVEWLGGALVAIVLGVMGGGLLAAGIAGAPISTGCGGRPAGTAFATQSGAFTGSGRMRVALGCGSLTMRSAFGSDWSVSGTESEGRAPRIEVDDATVSIDAGDRGSFFGNAGRTDWTVEVPTDPLVDLEIAINAGEGSIEPNEAHLGSVRLAVNAGSAHLLLGGVEALGDVSASVNLGSAVINLPPGNHSASVSLNAGSLEICMAPGAPMRVSWSGALGSNGLDAAGLTRVDPNTWESPGLDRSSPHLELQVSANAGSFSLDLDGTCAAG
jgi:hypothetical protein